MPQGFFAIDLPFIRKLAEQHFAVPDKGVHVEAAFSCISHRLKKGRGPLFTFTGGKPSLHLDLDIHAGGQGQRL